MRHRHLIAALALSGCLLALPGFAADKDKPTPTTKELLARSTASEWRRPDPKNLLVMQLPTGRVIIELAQDFSPLHAANIRTLVREHYFDGLAIIRVQDNFVTQWGDPNDDDNGDKSKLRSLGKASKTLPPEFTRAIDPKQPWTPLPDGDVYAPEVGFSGGFPVARDPASGKEWLAALLRHGWRGTRRGTKLRQRQLPVRGDRFRPPAGPQPGHSRPRARRHAAAFRPAPRRRAHGFYTNPDAAPAHHLGATGARTCPVSARASRYCAPTAPPSPR